METHKLPVGECPKFLSEALDRGMVGDDRRERIRSRPLIVADEDPCAHGQI